MSFDGSGVYSLNYTFATEAASPPIAISKLDTEFAGIATALSLCVLRNGNGVPTADTPWNAKKITGLGDATAATDAMNRQAGDARWAQLGGAAFTGAVSGTSASFSATLACAGNFAVNTDKFTVAGLTGNTTVAGTFSVTGGAAFTGAATFASTLSVTSNATVGGTLGVTGTVTGNLFSGSGASLTSLPAAQLTGSIADARLSSNVALYNATTANFTGTLQYGGVEVGFRAVPQNAQTGNYTCVAGDSGKHIYHASGAGAGDTYTIPANASVAYAVGTVLTFVNSATDAVSIAITSDTMTLAGTTTTGTRTLAQNGIATAIKVTTTSWLISGSGLT